MVKQIYIGLYSEGRSDDRFLVSIIRKAFDDVAFAAPGDFEFYIEPIHINRAGLSYPQQVLVASEKGVEQFGILVLCIHKDSDNDSDHTAFATSINPSIELLERSSGRICKVAVPIVPIQMIEAWLLADLRLLKNAIGTSLSNEELGFSASPETLSNPKRVIEDAIRIVQSARTRRRRYDLSLSQLYMPLGDQIPIESLNRLSSFLKFKDSVKRAFISLNFIHE